MRRTLLIPCLLSIAAACSSSGMTSEQKTKVVEGFTETASQYYAMGEYDRAISQCIKGLELDPDNTRLELVQAWSLQKRGATSDIAAAERIFRKLQSGGDHRAVLGLAEALERRGLAFAEAAGRMRSGARVTEAADPKKRVEDYEAEAEKAWTESRERYLKALELVPKSTDSLNGLVRVEILLGNPHEALVWADQLIRTAQETLDFWNQQILRTGISTSDEKVFRADARALTHMITAAHLTASDLSLSLNRQEEALAHLDAALKLDPHRPEIYVQRARIQKEMGQPEAAVRDIDKFIGLSSLDPNHPDIQRAWRLRKECQDLLR